MAGPLMLTFVSTLAFATQFLIFVYLYSSHRVRFFLYLLWAWGLFTLSKGLKLAETVLPPEALWDPLMSAAGVAAVSCLGAAALAYRWDYGVRRRDALGIVVAALGASIATAWAPGVERPVALLLGAVQVTAGVTFWPRLGRTVSDRGAGLLAAALVLWGLHRIGAQLMAIEPGTTAYLGVHGTFLLLYFLTTFAVIIMVLDRARAEMRSLKEFNERLVDGLREGLELVGGDFMIRHTNRWMRDQFGPLRGRRCYEVLTGDGQQCPGCPMDRRDTMEGPVRLEIAGTSGRRFLLSCSAVRQPNGETLLLELVADVTEQVRLRERLTAAERLAAAGELAAGVAHEIRNPLAAIVNATTLLDDAETLTAEERTSTLDAVRREARRLNRILSDFLVFARPRAPRRQPGDIREVVEHVAALIRDDHARASQVELTVRVDPLVPTFAFDRDQLTQVLWNIALNGVEAMDGCGRLFLEVGRHDGQVLIAVSDGGRGIGREEQGRVFEPFFSKKAGGTGLGLTIAQRIVAAHGGRIDLESSPGRGTRFTIALPLTTA
jgi:two-component system sensor histidine kinase HydH